MEEGDEARAKSVLPSCPDSPTRRATSHGLMILSATGGHRCQLAGEPPTPLGGHPQPPPPSCQAAFPLPPSPPHTHYCPFVLNTQSWQMQGRGPTLPSGSCPPAPAVDGSPALAKCGSCGRPPGFPSAWECRPGCCPGGRAVTAEGDGWAHSVASIVLQVWQPLQGPAQLEGGWEQLRQTHWHILACREGHAV